MPVTIDPSRYVYHPGVDEVGDIDLDVTPVYIDGKRYTEADAERDADEAEREVRAGLIPGGKSLSGDGRRSPVLRVVVGEAVADQVRARAAAEHMSVSRWLRRIVEREVA